MNDMISKLEFNLKFNGNTTLNNLELEVKANGEATNDYKYKEIGIYKVTNKDSACSLNDNSKLPNDYVLNNNENYVIKLENFNINNRNFDYAIFQSSETTFINSKDISELNQFCFNGNNNDGDEVKDLDISFNIPNEIIKTESNNTDTFTTQSDIFTTQEQTNLIQNESVDLENNTSKNDLLIPIMGGIIGILLIVIIILLTKIKKKNNIEQNKL